MSTPHPHDALYKRLEAAAKQAMGPLRDEIHERDEIVLAMIKTRLDYTVGIGIMAALEYYREDDSRYQFAERFRAAYDNEALIAAVNRYFTLWDIADRGLRHAPPNPDDDGDLPLGGTRGTCRVDSAQLLELLNTPSGSTGGETLRGFITEHRQELLEAYRIALQAEHPSMLARDVMIQAQRATQSLPGAR